MEVPFLDLRAQYLSIKDEIDAAIQQVLDRSAFAGGPFVEQFEKEFSELCGCRYTVGVGSGTEAIWLALLALGVGPGDEVITVPNTFLATAEAITFCGATPVFVDIDEKTYTLDPQRLYDYLKARNSRPQSRGKLKGVIPVHMFGHPADMDPIMEIAQNNGLFVLEDACQAHGAQYKGKTAGCMGDAGCFSFYPGKNLGAYGEAGAVVTNDSELQKRIRILRDHGQCKKYHHEVVGWNARMDGIQGAILSVKLKHLPTWNAARRTNALLYREHLSSVESVVLPKEADSCRHVYHVYAIRTPNRETLMAGLAEKGIQCGIHYPVPIHLQEAYRFLRMDNGSFPVSEKCAREFLSLPMFPELIGEQIEYVSEQIKRIVTV